MSVSNIKDYILEAIDRLRLRKARPNIDRICFYVQRHYAVQRDVVTFELDRLVRAGVVLQVIYKGNVSFRNPSSRSKSALELFHKRKRRHTEFLTDVQSAISKAFAILLLEDEDYLDTGIPGDVLVHTVTEDTSLKDASEVWNMLNSETNSGFLIKLPNGNYSLNSGVAERCSNVKETSPSCAFSIASYSTKRSVVQKHSNSKVESSNGTQSFRVGVRRKKPKKVFDPSDNYLPKRRIGYSTPAQLKKNSVCSVCLKPIQENLVSCSSCTKTAHSSCISEVDWSDTFIWMCKSCQFCSICHGDGESGVMLTCVSCSDSCHLSCHDPSATEVPDIWKCLMCSDDDSVEIIEVHINEPPENQPKKLNVADIASWTVDEVFQYLSGKGCNSQAEAFKENDVDGLSLLLLTRNDVLYGLHLKLGPALKAYKQVHLLQMQYRERTDSL